MHAVIIEVSETTIILMCAMIAVALVVVMFFTKSMTCCPDCSERLPHLQFRKSRRARLWGGWTCSRCGCEIDKSGKKVPPDTDP